MSWISHSTRSIRPRLLGPLVLLLLPLAPSARAATLTGRVLDESGASLPRAIVQIEALQLGALADSSGRFAIADLPAGTYVIRVSMMGFETAIETLEALDVPGPEVVVRLSSAPVLLDAISVEGERTGSGVTDKEIVRTEVIARGDLVESADRGSLMSALDGQTGLKTRPCAMCGSCGIGMQGLEPSYTEVNVDGLPVFSGLGTLYGLDGIAAGDVERLELVKGTGSSLYGSGAIAGAVNLVSVAPEAGGALEIRASSDQHGQSSLYLGASTHPGGVPMRLSVSAGATPDRIDTNDDGVTDVPESWRTSVGASAEAPAGGGTLRLGGRAYWEDRFAGEVGWTPRDRGSSTVYGREIQTRRQEISLRWRGASDGNRLWSARGALVRHEQDSWYGTQEYAARQRLGLFMLTVEQFWSEPHTTVLEAGLSGEDYDDNLRLLAPTDLRYVVPSLVVQHSWKMGTALTVQAGNRAESYEEDGVILTPRMTAAWDISPGTTLRLSAGTGYRPVTLFSLDVATEAGFDSVQLGEDLRAEESAAVAAALARRWLSDWGSARVDLNLFYTDFRNKAVIEHAEGSDIFVSNASDAFSRGFEVQASGLHQDGWNAKLGYTRSEVRYRTVEGWRDVELQYAYTADGTVGRDWKEAGLSTKVSAVLYGPQHLPEGRGRDRAEPYALFDAAVRKRWGRLSASFGVNNVFDRTQDESPYVRDPETGRLRPDAALIYAPVLGRAFVLSLGFEVGG
ncbi:MAG: TonB-dependent receptor [Candidatus Eisenbacteria bacterium]|nr:TonB-dependent receptor [Candidatus Eisenbacteria bacterium]